MVKITNKLDTKVVTKGAYESFYKPLGYEIVDEKSTKVVKEEPIVTKTNNESQLKENNKRK